MKMLLGNCRCNRRARGACAPTRARFVVADLSVQRLIKTLRLVSQHHEVDERIGVDERKSSGARKKNASSGSRIEERQPDRALEKEIRVRHRARGDREIKQDKQIGEPQPPPTEAASSTAFLIASRSSAFLGNFGRPGVVASDGGSGRPQRCGTTFERHGFAGIALGTLLRRQSAFPIPRALAPRPNFPGGRRDDLFLHQSRAASNERPRPPKIFRQFLAESQKRSYNGARMNEDIESADHRQGGRESVRTCAHIGPRSLAAQKKFA